ncbi:MAG: hypothetical protein WDO56_05715 [Gammaproteobacteria bacterium]
MRSTVGRPRQATDEQVKSILTWHAEYLAWLAKRPVIPTQRALARHLNLHPTAVNRIIRHRGQYKQSSPEARTAEQERRRARMRLID